MERLFGTLNSELLPELPGYIVKGKPVTSPKLTLADLDSAIGIYIGNTYNVRVHSQTGETPLNSWRGDGWLPRMPESLEDLDLLLVMVAKPRTVRRDGIHFQGLRYIDPTLAAYVGEPVTIRFDPRDLSELRVFHHNRFLCRAISPEHAGRTVTLKDIQTARSAYRRSLRTQINERVARVTDLLSLRADVRTSPPINQAPTGKKKTRLRTYFEDD